MKLSQLAFLCPLILLPVSSYGETTFPAIGASSTSTAKPTTHTVIVGGQFGNLTYEPMNTLANPGDEMLFLMRAKNHSVTQSGFPTPCEPLSQTSNTSGIFSDFLPPLDPMDDSHGFFSYKFKVNDSKPIWLYCSQTNHCNEGMVAAVNAPPMGNTIEAFQALAIKSGISSPVIPPVQGGTIIPPVRTVHTMIAGGDDLRLVYEPGNITAKPGDLVRVLMRSKNHTVTQSKFETPCKPLMQTSGKPGLFSGFIPPSNVSDDSSGDRFFEFTVNDTNPIWFYCSQTNHCVGGMVGAVNAQPEGNITFDAYKKLAMESNIFTPYIPLVFGGRVVNASTSYEYGYDNSKPGSYGSEHDSTDLAEASTTAHKAKSIAEGIVIGIVVGAVGLLLLSVLTVYCCCCRKRNSRAAPGPERGDRGFMSYAASSYRSVNSPALGINVDKHSDYEPLVPPGERINAPNDDYHPSGAYDPPQPTYLGQYSTAWDQRR